jgi:glucose-6-phosphate 1-epimerase
VISWKSGTKEYSDPVENLFVSKKAIFDGSMPIRGGIPIVFPCFGPPVHPQHSKLSQHGFARSEQWKWDKVLAETETEVSVQLSASFRCYLVRQTTKRRVNSFGTHSQHHSEI